MTANYVAIVQLQREAAQLTAMSRIVEQKLGALATRDDVRATSLMDQLATHLREARHYTLNAAGVLRTLLAEPKHEAAPIGECEICHDPILTTETVGAFASGLCHQECAEKAIDQADAARQAANDAYERGR